MRKGEVKRDTAETQVTLRLDLDGSGKAEIDTGIGFFDHMLTHVARHGAFDLVVNAKGDLQVDSHHTVEDVGICLGKAFREALGDCVGLTRFGHAVVPMDETLAEVAIDLSGRPFLSFRADLPGGSAGEFDSELAEEFFRAFAVHARATVHVVLRYGTNLHHCMEALFKAAARALDVASRLDPRVKEIPSTKGMIDE